MIGLGRLALLNGSVALLLTAGWFALRPAREISPLTDILFPLAIGLATYFGGRINGGVWLLVPAARLAIHTGADAGVSFVECILLYAFTSMVISGAAEAARARDQLRALIASMQDIVVVLDDDGTYVEVTDSPALARPAGDLTGRNLRDFFSPAEAALFLGKIKEALLTQSTVIVDYSLTIDGLERSFNAAVSPLQGRQVVWVARDVTEAKRNRDALEKLNAELEQRIAVRTRDLAETIDALHGEVEQRVRAIEALTESQERFHLIARATNDVIWDWDLTTNHLWLSESHLEHFGGEAPGLDGWLKRVHPEEREFVSAKRRSAIESEDVKFVVQYRYERADGTYAVVLDRGHVAREASGQARRMVGAMIDVSEQHELVKRLEQERRVSSLGRIAASMAHEFNNVTMAIQSNLEAIRHHADPRMEAPLKHVFAAISRSKRITEQILSYTRPSPPEKRPVDVIRLLSDWKEEIAAVMPSSIEVSIEVHDPVLHIDADPLQITQVLTNLAINARDAMPDGGGLTIAATAESETRLTAENRTVIHFHISDTGCGMTPEELSNAFEPLYTTKRQGTGLGLVISRQIALQHGGYLSAESTRGRGSTFHLIVPASTASDVPRTAASMRTFSCRRILLVEDDPAVAAGLTTLLETTGVDVVVAHDGASGAALALRSPPDCLILDVGLPDIDGTEVFERVRSRHPTLPVIFSSGHADASRLRQYLMSERVALVIKPYTFAELSVVLESLCR